MDLLYFILLVSILIFIHESGHFAFAKIFGVKVITFSIGFGPRLLKIRGKETEYCLGLLPFGGFVKMLEGRSGEPILPEERNRTFESQALWKRIVIVLAGPAMNVLFPIVLYTSVFLEDRTLLPPTVGVVLPGRPADGKLEPGDHILAVDGESVDSFPDVQSIIARRAGKPTRMGVERDGKAIEVTLTPADEVEQRELDIVDHVGRIGFAPTYPAAVIGVPRTDSPAYRAGLRTFDRIVAINGRKVERLIDLQAALAANRGDTVPLTYQRPVEVPNAMGGLCGLAVMSAQVAMLTPQPRAGDNPVAPGDANERAADVMARVGIEGTDLYVSLVPEGSGEAKAGLRAGDRLVSLDGAPARSWESLNRELLRGANKTHDLTWTHDGQPMAGRFELRREQWDDELGQHYERYVFRTTHWVPVSRGDTVPNPHRILYALGHGLGETSNVIQFIGVGFVRILQGRVSLSSVSGPITLYDIAGQAGAKGPAYFVWAMALVSVNLGLINLLPIPVLDGGHLAFFLVEWARKKPLPLRVREVASLVGMSVLVALTMLAFKNDVERRWDVIIGQLREIFS
ncbi:MAG TPA: RIP metalloprotease RseP [Polyangiaceae bacterium]